VLFVRLLERDRMFGVLPVGTGLFIKSIHQIRARVKLNSLGLLLFSEFDTP